MSLTYDAVFPTIIGKCERQDLLTNVQEILDSIDKDEYFEYSNGQTFDILPTLLKKEFEKEFINFLKVVLKINCDVQLTTSWFTHKSAGRHSHVNSWWSAVYYLVEDSEIEFTTKSRYKNL